MLWGTKHSFYIVLGLGTLFRESNQAKQTQHVSAASRHRGRNLLRACGHSVVTCWMLPKFMNGQTMHATFLDVAWRCTRLARFVQQCCARACAIVRFTTLDMSQHVATAWPLTRAACCARQCCDKSRWNVSIVWPGLKLSAWIFVGLWVLEIFKGGWSFSSFR